MTSEASSTTTNARKRKLVDSEADEVFVLQKKQALILTKTVSISIPNLLEKIDNENNKKNPVDTPIFKLGHLDFYFQFKPQSKEGRAGFYIVNCNKVEVIISMELKEKPTMIRTAAFERKTIEANTGWGWPISQDDYRECAAQNGDVFKMRAVVTLHIQEGSTAGEEWTTLR